MSNTVVVSGCMSATLFLEALLSFSFLDRLGFEAGFSTSHEIFLPRTKSTPEDPANSMSLSEPKSAVAIGIIITCQPEKDVAF